MTHTPPSTAIIGAGISGLTAGKKLADAGVPYDCFEISDRVGGNWAFRNPNGMSSAYRSLHIDTSKERLSFDDFPMGDDLPDFPHHTQVHQYLEDYADAFDLRKSIQFGNGVEQATRLDGGGWELRTQDGQTRHYDALVVANGHHWDPRLPDFPGTFAGESIHAHAYIDPTEPLDLRGKRIVVVGIGNSAGDLVSELSQKSWQNTVFLSTRSGAWVVPKYVFGMPADKIAQTLPIIPLSWQRRVLRPLPRLLFGSPEKYGLPTPNHRFLEAHPTQSAELLMRLGSGDATAKPNIERFDGHDVHFVDGTVEEVDVVIYATGYNITFPFVEVQSRLLAAYLSGQYRLPGRAQMQRVMAADTRKYNGHYVQSARHTQQVDHFDYKRDIGRRELPGRASACREARRTAAGRTGAGLSRRALSPARCRRPRRTRRSRRDARRGCGSARGAGR